MLYLHQLNVQNPFPTKNPCSFSPSTSNSSLLRDFALSPALPTLSFTSLRRRHERETVNRRSWLVRFPAKKNGRQLYRRSRRVFQKPPPNWQDIVNNGREEERSNENWDDDQKIIQKMKICKKFYNGEECPYAERCNFLHEDPRKFRDDSGRFRESYAISIGTTGTPPPPPGYEIVPDQSEGSRYANNNSDLFRAGGRSSYWKTKLCSRYETTGHCPFAEKCHFAHGQAELTSGRMEGGDLRSVTTIIPVKPTPAAPSNDAPESSTSAVHMVPLNQDEAAKKKSLLKLKLQNKKINRIYGDWLDDSDED